MAVIAGIRMENTVDMIKWASEHSIPESLLEKADAAYAGGLVLHGGSGLVVRGGGEDEGMMAKELKALWTIPMTYEDYPETEAVLMTGNTQLKWIGQLAMSTVR
jgi:hypothetical protein